MPRRTQVPDDVLATVAADAARDAGGVPAELLGDFLTALVAAVVAGEPIAPTRLRPYRTLGDRAARQGVALRALLDLYLSAAWRLWRHLPPVAGAAEHPDRVVVAGEVMLHATDDVVAALAEGYQLARRSLVRTQESARREFIDDLLNGATDVVGVLHRAAGFGLDLSGPHAVATVAAEREFSDGAPLVATLERAILGIKGDAPAAARQQGGPAGRRVRRARPGGASSTSPRAWPRRSGAPAAAGHRSARGASGWAAPPSAPTACWPPTASRWTPSRSPPAWGWTCPSSTRATCSSTACCCATVRRWATWSRAPSAPCTRARGGAPPLLQTLAAWFDAGGNSAAAARALHLSVRAVTYRLERVRTLTGLDPDAGQDRFALQVAVLGARLLGWPTTGSQA